MAVSETRRAYNKAYYKANALKLRADAKAYRKANPEKRRAYEATRYIDKRWEWMLHTRYGIEPGTYAKMLQAQDGVCAICGTDKMGSKSRFDVDHSHVTNKVRALLCNPCNRGLGNFMEDPVLLEKAAAYMRKWDEQHKNV